MTDRFGSFLQGVDSASRRALEELRRRIEGTQTDLGALDARVAAFETYTWTQPTLINSWVDFGGAYPVAAYRKTGDLVEIRGLVKGGLDATAIFTLPVGFRPPAEVYFASSATDAYCLITVSASGNVSVFNADVTSWVSLSGIAFSTT